MATGPWDSFKPQQTEESRGPWTQFGSAAIDELPEFKKPEPTESGGLTGSYLEALKERFSTAVPTAKLYTGLGSQKEATDELLKYQEDSHGAFKQTEFSDIGKAFKEGHYGDALSKTVDKFKEIAGSSLGSMTPAIAAGQATGMVAGPLAGTAAFGVVMLGSYLADNIYRQKQEQEKQGDKYADINRLTATTAAAGQTALDIFGFKFFKPLGRLVGIEGKEAAERTALEIVEAATQPKAYRNAVLRGTAEGVAFEVPQEVAQQVLERWQAGLSINPFDDPEAAKEYAEAAGGALLLGGPMGGGSRLYETYKARQTPEGQTLLQGTDAIQSKILESLGGEQDVRQPINEPVGAGTEVDTQPPAGPPAAGATTVDTGRVVRTDGTTARPDAREAAPASSLEDFHRQYNDLRDEALELMSKTRPTPEDGKILQLVLKDFNSIINENVGLIGKQNAEQLRNPMFDGNNIIGAVATQQVVGQAKASQGNLFGSFEGTNRLAQTAMAFAGRDPVKALQYLEDRRQRALDEFEKNKEDPTWAMTYSSQLGMTKGEAARNPEIVARHVLNQVLGNVDQAKEQISRTARPSQGGLFDEGKPQETTPAALTGQEKAALLRGEQAEMIGDATDPENLARMELIRRQQEIEKNRKNINYEVTQTTPQERLAILTQQEAELNRKHKDALAEHKRLVELGARPVEERFARPTGEQISKAANLAKDYNKQLQGVRLEIEKVKKEPAPTTPVQPKQAETPTLVESKQAQPKLFADEQAPKFQLSQEEIDRRQEARDKYLSKKEQEEISYAKENRLANVTKKDFDEAVSIRDAALKKLRALEESLQKAAAKDAPKSQIDKIMADIELAKREYRVAAIEVADIYDVLEDKGYRFESKDASQKLKEDEEIKESTEHIPETEEGRIISDFFDSIQPATNDEPSVVRHGSSKNTAAETLLEYDIAEPGEKSSEGARKMLDYIASLVGGLENLKTTIPLLYEATPAQQARIFERLGLPNLTTIRGMDKFRDDIQRYVEDLHSSGEGINLITRSMPSPFHGRTIPYTETVTTTGLVTQTYTSEAGKLRAPNQAEVETEHVIVDRKLRNAILMLKQALSVGKGITDRQHAAINYLFKNKHRDTFGHALADLAFDLAYGVISPKEYGANSQFFGEGGKYAKDFREWIVLNLDQSTVDILNEMVAEHARNHEQNIKYKEAEAQYKAQRDKRTDKKIEAYEKRTKTKLPRAPRKVRITDIKEEKLGPINLPTTHIVLPIISRLLEQGKVNEALTIMADSKGNPYYSALAQRLLDTNLTASARLIGTDVIESLNNNPKIRESLDTHLDVLRDLVATMYPTDKQASIIAGLRSSRLSELVNAVQTLQDTIDSVGASDAQKETLKNTYKLLDEEFNWNGKYDPATDQIVMRTGGGKLTNTLFLHEAIHAAASHLIDNADKLTGIQRQGYDRLVELYEYSKKTLITEEFKNEFYDLHEFISYALTDPEFQSYLQGLGYKSSPISLWNVFTEAIRKLFKISKGAESNVMVETILAVDTLLAGTMALEGLNVAGAAKAAKPKQPKTRVFRPGMPNQPGMIARVMKGSPWSQQAMKEFRSMAASARPAALGLLTLRQIDDLVAGRIPQLSNFIKVTEDFLARKNSILKESGEISKAWEKLQGKDPDMSRQIGLVMHMATITEVDPDTVPKNKRNANQPLMDEWDKLDEKAKKIYRDVRDFYERRYSNYKQLMNRRIIHMRQMGVSEKTILEIRNEYERAKIKGPYFPLMRFGRFWYEIGPRGNREYYMFESQAARDAHIQERIAKDPHLADTIGTSIGNDYKSQMDHHARESNLVREMFNAIDSIDVTGLTPTGADAKKQALKDDLYLTYIQNMPENSIRKKFTPRQNKAGYSEDALRSFASSSFNMAYQMARFQYSPDMFSQLEAAKLQVKGRYDPKVGFDPAVVRENDELNDYIGEARRRLDLILNPTDIGTIPSMLSNIGFIYYLSSAASAVTNVLGGVMIGFPTLVGQTLRLNPKMSYTQAAVKTLFETSKSASQAIAGMAKGTTAPPSGLSRVEQAAFNRFVADGLIDITATYDQSGLASMPTEHYSGFRYKAMKALTFLFHQAERLNREVMAMSAFRTAYEQATASGLSPRAAFTKAIADAKDATNRSMFDYSSTNKPRYFQHPVARVVLQFKQFPQQMTFFLTHNLMKSLKGQTPEVKREARARFVGTMGMAAIMSGVTGLWGFSTVASVVNAVVNAMAEEGDDELPFDFELAFANWAAETFGSQVGMAVSRGIPNAVTGLDIGGRVKLDDLWFRDGRKNLDEAEALQSFLIDLLGPTVGLGINAARAVDLWNQGHGDRAIEAVSPSIAKNVLVAGRMAREGGATTLRGDMLTENDSPFILMMQALGLRSAELAERQYYNITIKGQEQAILKQRQNVLNYYGLTFMANDVDANQEAFDKIMEFNMKHPTVAIPAGSITSSIINRMKKSAQTDYGLYIDPRLKAQLSEQDYLANQ
jgi:hypothetical protein